MKSWTLLRIILLSFFMSACSRNPLGEDLKQPILNLALILLQNCNNTLNQDANYSCQIQTSEPAVNLVWSLNAATTCTWAVINPTTGVITGTPNDNQVGNCQVTVDAKSGKASAIPLIVPIQVNNIAPTLTIANAASILEDSPLTVIRDDASVQASEEGWGTYGFAHATTTSPRCFDNATTLSIDSLTGAVSYAPALNYAGTCYIRVAFDDGNGVANSVVTSEFSITVTPVNDAPVISPIAAQMTNENTALVLNFTVTDVDSPISCSADIVASSSNSTLIPVSNIVFSGTAPNCTATITPVLTLNGSSNIAFFVSDGFLSDTKSFLLTVNPVNDPPIMSPIANQTTLEDTPLVIPFTITDIDSTLTCSMVNLAATSSNTTLLPVANIVFGGTAPNCTATITPLLNQSGVSNLTFTVNDNGAPNLQDTKSFTLTVTAVNDPPVLSVIVNQTTNEDTPLVINFTINDVDNTLTCAGSMSATSSNTALMPVANIVFSGTAPNCVATLSPALNQFGVSNLAFTVTDGTAQDVQNFSLTVNAVNDPPVMSTIANQTTVQDTPLVINFTINDVDNTLSCTGSMSATSSNTTLLPIANIVFGGTAPNCTATLSPAFLQNGVSNLSFTVTDAGALTDIKNFTFTVTAFNYPPVLSAIANQTTLEDTPFTVNFNISDLDNTLTCAGSMSATSSNTTLLPVANIVFGGTAPNCTATITPFLNQNGSSNLTFTVTDGVGTDTKSFSVTVTAVNDAPVISTIVNQTTNEDTPLVINFTINDVDNTLTCVGSMSATSSNASLLPVANIVFSGTAPNCVATLSPALNQYGVSNLAFTVTDGTAQDVQNFSLTVNAVNDAPVLSTIANQTMNEGTTLNLPFTINDVDSILVCSSLNLAVTSSNTALLPVANIVFSGTAPNCVAAITPVANTFGTTTIQLTLSDGGTPILQDVKSFNLNVTAVDDPPTISVIGNQTTNEDTPRNVNFTIADIDSTLSCTTSVSASSSNTTLLPVARIVFSGTAPNCVATLSPALNQYGVSNLIFTVTDGNSLVTQTFSLTVTSVNDAPVLSNIPNQSTPQDTPRVVNFTMNDVDDVLSCSAAMSATSSNASLIPVANIVFSGTAPNCTATLTPVYLQNGVSTISFTVTDGGGLTDTKSFNLTVSAVNYPPVLSAISAQSTAEDTPLNVNFTITDLNETLDCTTSVSATSSNTTLLPVANVVFSGTAPNCVATLSPALNQFGISNLVFTVTDSGALTDTKSFSLTVTAVNDAPVISSITNQTTPEDTPLAVNFTISDVDNTLSCATSVSATSSNTTLLPVAGIIFSGTAPNCVATLSPALNQFGTSNLVFTVTDSLLTNTSSFSLTVTSVNDAPIISSIINQTTAEDTPLAINFTISDVDNTLSCATSVSATSSNTTLLPVANIVFSGTAPNCTATLSSALNQFGTSNLVFTVTDGLLTNASSFSLTVTAVNDAPVISTITNQTTPEDTPLAVNFTINDVDNTLSCATSVSATSSNTTLLPVAGIVFSGTAPNCVATLTSSLDQVGVSNLVFTVTDGLLTNTSSFSLTVTAVNDAPVISSIINQTTAEDTPLAINFTINDVDSTLSCATSVSATSSNTTLLPVASIVFSGTAPNCVVTVSPSLNQFGTSNLVFTVTDGLLTNTSSFSLTVTAVNDAPVISSITNQTTPEDIPLAVNFTISDVDNTLSCATSVSATSSNTTLLPVANIVFSGSAPNCVATLSPGANFNGVSNIVLTVTDGALTSTSNFSFTVTSVDDPPVLSSISNQTISEDSFATINFTATDVDSPLSCITSISATSSNTGLLPVANIVFSGTAPNCTATLTPLANQNGISNISFTLTDGNSTDVKNFSLTVTAVNDAPVMSAIGSQTTNEDTAFAVNFTITDIDSVLLCTSLNLSLTSSNTSLVPVASVVWSGTAPNCTATITPALNQNGTANLTFTVVDNGTPNLQDAKTFALTVNAVNDAPVLSAIANQTTLEDTPLAVNFTITDVDNTLNCATSVTASTNNASLVPVANIVFSGTAPNCTATLTPVANQNGSVGFTFRVSDGTDYQDQSFSLTVTAVDDPPVLSSIAAQSVNEDTAVVVNFTITDVDSPLSCTTSMSAASSNTGLLPVSNIVFAGTAPNCTATLTPVSNQTGSSNVDFTLTDTVTNVVRSFTYTVIPVDDPPVLSAISNQTTNEDTPFSINFTITDPDSTLTCSGSVNATSSNTALLPVANIVFSGTAPNCVATVTPVLNQNGVSNISFTVTDNTALTDVKNFSITVNAVNDPPVISAIGDDVTNEDTPLVINFTISDVDNVLNCATSMSATSTNTSLLPVSNISFGGTAPNCTATLTPIANANGTTDLVFTVTDGSLSATAAFNLIVNPVNDPPTIAPISAQSTLEDTPFTLNFTINDIDSPLSCNGSVLVTSSNNTLLPASTSFAFSGTAPNCSVVITPAANRFGSSNVNFFVTDGTNIASRNFTVVVTSVNDAPVISSISAQSTNESTPIAINFTISDVDNILTCSSTNLSMASSNTSLIPVANVVWSGTAPNCTATITPAGTNFGTSNLDFVVTDGSLTATSSFVLTVVNVNQAPTITSISNQNVYEARPVTVSFTLFDNDGPLTCSATNLSATSSNTTLLPVANIVFGGSYPNCTATISTATAQSGTANVTITVTDSIATNSSSFVVTGYKINSVALSPTTPIVPKNSNFSFTLTATYSDSSVRNITTNSTWTTSNTAISSFPSAGVLNNTYAGATTASTTITGTFGAYSANTVATINPATITSLFVNPTSANMNIGDTLQIRCYGITSDNGVVELTQSCSWASANTTIVTVDNSLDKGLVSAVNLGSATNITATYSSFSASAAVTVDVTAPSQSDNGTGLTAQYYAGGTNFNTLTNTRIDSVVNFNWAAGNNPAGSADSFSVRWTGSVKAPTTGTYTFYTQSDDGVRMWVNGTQIINNWTNHSSVENSGTISLTAGTKYTILLEFYENSGSAQIELRYSGPSVSKQIIPQSNLYP